MALFYSRERTRSLINQAIEETKKKHKQGAIREALGVQSLDRAKADVAKWRTALEEWEDPNQPDRYEMMQLYQEVIQDDSIATHLNTIIRAIEGTEFEIGKPTKEGFNADQVKTDEMKGVLIEEVIRHIIEAEMMGFTLVEITPKEGEKYTEDNVQLIPRHLVIPEKGMVRKRAQVNLNLIDYNQPAYVGRLLQVGNKTEKGLFNNIMLLYIYKKNALAYWANYQSKFGIPPVIVKTDLENNTKLDSLVSFLQDMRSNSFSLVGFDDEISILNGVNADAFSTFQELIDHCDRQMAKVMEGQTMTSDDGSSRSQAEVHERTGDKWHIARLRRIERIINSQLIPILNQDGAGLDGFTFRFKEVKNVDEIIDRVVKLKQAGFTVDAEYLSEITGLPLEAAPAAPVQQPESVMKAIDNLYSDIFKCSC